MAEETSDHYLGKGILIRTDQFKPPGHRTDNRPYLHHQNIPFITLPGGRYLDTSALSPKGYFVRTRKRINGSLETMIHLSKPGDSSDYVRLEQSVIANFRRITDNEGQFIEVEHGRMLGMGNAKLLLGNGYYLDEYREESLVGMYHVAQMCAEMQVSNGNCLTLGISSLVGMIVGMVYFGTDEFIGLVGTFVGGGVGIGLDCLVHYYQSSEGTQSRWANKIVKQIAHGKNPEKLLPLVEDYLSRQRWGLIQTKEREEAIRLDPTADQKEISRKISERNSLLEQSSRICSELARGDHAIESLMGAPRNKRGITISYNAKSEDEVKRLVWMTLGFTVAEPLNFDSERKQSDSLTSYVPANSEVEFIKQFGKLRCPYDHDVLQGTNLPLSALVSEEGSLTGGFVHTDCSTEDPSGNFVELGIDYDQVEEIAIQAYRTLKQESNEIESGALHQLIEDELRARGHWEPPQNQIMKRVRV